MGAAFVAYFLAAALTTFLGALLGAAFLAAVALARGIFIFVNEVYLKLINLSNTGLILIHIYQGVLGFWGFGVLGFWGLGFRV